MSSFTDVVIQTLCCVLILYMSFNPPGRVVLDAVSSLTTGIIKSLKLGCLRGCKFNVCFRRDEFNFLVVALFIIGLENYNYLGWGSGMPHPTKKIASSQQPC